MNRVGQNSDDKWVPFCKQFSFLNYLKDGKELFPISVHVQNLKFNQIFNLGIKKLNLQTD